MKFNNFFPYILLELQGGIGNLLFEYAAGLKISRMKNARLVIHDMQPGSKDWLESYLGVKHNDASDLELLLMGNATKIKKKKIYYLIRLLTILKIRFGKEFHGGFMQGCKLNEIPNSFSGLNLNGYYQHSDFYESIINEILAMIGQTAFGDNYSKANFLEQTVIQLRRGDYLHHPGWSLPKEYYINALLKTDPNRRDPVTVVSNEPFAVDAFYNYCEKEGYKIIRLDNEVVKDDQKIQSKNTAGNFITNSTRDFRIIAQSKRVIMSNCTLCWWAISLGDFIFGTEKKETIYPKGWIPHFPDVLKRPNWKSFEPYSYDDKRTYGQYDSWYGFNDDKK